MNYSRPGEIVVYFGVVLPNYLLPYLSNQKDLSAFLHSTDDGWILGSTCLITSGDLLTRLEEYSTRYFGGEYPELIRIPDEIFQKVFSIWVKVAADEKENVPESLEFRFFCQPISDKECSKN